MSDFEQSLDQQHVDSPRFDLPSNFDDMSFNKKQAIIKGLAGAVYQHLLSTSLDPTMVPDELKSVIGDLLANAVDATKGLERDIRVQALRQEANDQPRVIIEILDNGPGFPTEKLNQDLSAPIGTTRTVQGNLGGQGSGLHYCNLLVTKAHGSISYGNREEGGAFVRLGLPAYKKFDVTSYNTVYLVR